MRGFRWPMPVYGVHLHEVGTEVFADMLVAEEPVASILHSIRAN